MKKVRDIVDRMNVFKSFFFNLLGITLAVIITTYSPYQGVVFQDEPFCGEPFGYPLFYKAVLNCGSAGCITCVPEFQATPYLINIAFWYGILLIAYLITRKISSKLI